MKTSLPEPLPRHYGAGPDWRPKSASGRHVGLDLEVRLVLTDGLLAVYQRRDDVMFVGHLEHFEQNEETKQPKEKKLSKRQQILAEI